MSAQRRADDVVAEVAGVLDDALLLEDVDAGDGRRAGQRVARSRSARPGTAASAKVSAIAPADDHAAERDVAGVDALGEADQVGRDAPAVDGEPLAAAAEPGHHLVGDHHDAVLRRTGRGRPAGSRRAARGCRSCRRRSRARSRRSCWPPSTMITSARWASARSHSSASSAAWNAERYGVRPPELDDAGDARLAAPSGAGRRSS